MHFCFNGGIAAVMVTIIDNKGVFDPSKNLCREIYEEHLAEKFDFTQIIEHNITIVLNNLLFGGFHKATKFYSRWRTFPYEDNLIPRRFFFSIFNEYNHYTTDQGYEPQQFIKTTELLYRKVQEFLKVNLGIKSEFNIFSGLVYDSPIDHSPDIATYLHSINFVEVIECTKSMHDIMKHREWSRAYRVRNRNKGISKSCLSDQAKGLTKRQQKTDRLSRNVTKRDLKISALLYDLDKDLLDILRDWKASLATVLEDRIPDLCIITRKQIIDLVMKDFNINLTRNRPKKWQSIIKASYADLQSYELLQELDNYLQEL